MGVTRARPASPETRGGIGRYPAVDLFTIAYLGLGLLLLLFRGARPSVLVLAPLHAAGIAGLILFRRSERFQTSFLGSVLEFYPLPLFGLFYSEIATLNQLLHGGRMFDPWIQGIEMRLFGCQPSHDLALWWPMPWLGEYLHFGYFSYYLLVPVLAFVLRFREGLLAYQRAIACVALAFYISFLFFITLPVAGPYYSFTPPEADRVGMFLPHIVRWVLDHGSSVGAAFPSSHVAVSLSTWIMAMRYHRRLAVIYAFIVPALAMGAIYGGYHYATDVLAGALLGLGAGTLGHRWVTGLTPDRSRPVQPPAGQGTPGREVSVRR
jgi:membrane-associated phospholipid phosphatase